MNTLFKGPKTVTLGSKQQSLHLLCFSVKSQEEQKETEMNSDKALSGKGVKEPHGEI